MSSLVGLRILVDITEFDKDGAHRRTTNFAGVIEAATEGQLHIRRDGTGTLEEVAVEEEDLEPADPGEYWLRTTGEAVPQPDLLAEFTRYERLSAEQG